MSEEAQAVDETQREQDAPQDAGKTPANSIQVFSEEAQRVIKELRKENAGHRKATKSAKTAADVAAQAKLIEDGQLQEVIDSQQAQIAEYEPLTGEVEQLRGVVGKILIDTIAEYGDTAKTAVEGLPETMTAPQKLEWLTANKALFTTTRPTAPNIDAQVVGAGATAPTATDEQRQEIAARLGLRVQDLPPDLSSVLPLLGG